MEKQFERTQLLFGKNSIKALKKCRVAVFGIGGVGGYAVEALARAGVGAIDLIDNDTVSISNLNRQIIATHKTVGSLKTEIARQRILEINPECNVTIHSLFFDEKTAPAFNFSDFDYVIDAIDTVSSKIELVLLCVKAGTPIISSMGTGNKIDPTKFEIADIYKTSVCPLARVMRTELKKRGVKGLKVVYSKELPAIKERVPASCSFVPPVAGFILAGEVIKQLITTKNIDKV